MFYQHNLLIHEQTIFCYVEPGSMLSSIAILYMCNLFKYINTVCILCYLCQFLNLFFQILYFWVDRSYGFYSACVLRMFACCLQYGANICFIELKFVYFNIISYTVVPISGYIILFDNG